MHRSSAVTLKALSSLPKPFGEELQQLLSLRSWNSAVNFVGESLRGCGGRLGRSYASLPAEAETPDRAARPASRGHPPRQRTQSSNPQQGSRPPQQNVQGGRPAGGGERGPSSNFSGRPNQNQGPHQRQGSGGGSFSGRPNQGQFQRPGEQRSGNGGGGGSGGPSSGRPNQIQGPYQRQAAQRSVDGGRAPSSSSNAGRPNQGPYHQRQADQRGSSGGGSGGPYSARANQGQFQRPGEQRSGGGGGGGGGPYSGRPNQNQGPYQRQSDQRSGAGGASSPFPGRPGQNQGSYQRQGDQRAPGAGSGGNQRWQPNGRPNMAQQQQQQRPGEGNTVGGSGGGGNSRWQPQGQQQQTGGRPQHGGFRQGQSQQQQQQTPMRPRKPAVRPVPWWEKQKKDGSAAAGAEQLQQPDAQRQQGGPVPRPVPWWERKPGVMQQQGGRTNQQQQRRPIVPKEPEPVVIPDGVTLSRLAHLLGVGVKELEKVLTDLGDPPRSDEDAVAPDSVELAALELGKTIVLAPPVGGKKAAAAAKAAAASGLALTPRPAVVTVMGHVDHGKTTLLDVLRKTSVAAKESGGITQHVGAFEVAMPGCGAALTFLDTPGHAAFSAMRARGAAVTDLVVLVVAADDGVMPQTREALAHAVSAGCPIVVAITKCDAPAANPEKVRRQLSTAGVLLEGMGGSVQVIEVSAVSGKGLAELEEALMLEGEMLELAADPEVPAMATVIEARMDRGQGPVATVIVTRGTLRVGQPIVVGSEWGKVRAIKTCAGDAAGAAGVTPGRPAEVMGLKQLPMAGDELMSVASEERAQRISKARTDRSEWTRRAGLGALNDASAQGGGVDGEEEQRTIPIVIKADVQGSAEAVRDAINNLSSKAVQIKVIHAGVGPVSLSDVTLAVPSSAKVLGFNVKVAADAESEAKMHGVQVLTRRVIYELLGDVAAMVEGATPRPLQEVVLGSAQVMATFQVTVKGRERRLIAGCRVSEGSMKSGMRVKVVRGGETVAEGLCDSLRRHKLDVDAVGQGTECGLGLEGFQDFQQGDILQCVEMQ